MFRDSQGYNHTIIRHLLIESLAVTQQNGPLRLQGCPRRFHPGASPNKIFVGEITEEVFPGDDEDFGLASQSYANFCIRSFIRFG